MKTQTTSTTIEQRETKANTSVAQPSASSATSDRLPEPAPYPTPEEETPHLMRTGYDPLRYEIKNSRESTEEDP